LLQTINEHDEGICLVACLHSCTDVTLEKSISLIMEVFINCYLSRFAWYHKLLHYFGFQIIWRMGVGV